MTAKWSVVTVTYNSLSHLERHWVDDPGSRGFEWVVVDNGSTDGSVEYAKRHASRVIESGGNHGFSIANNLGLAAIDTEYVAFVNPDVTVEGSRWQPELESLIQATGGFVAPQLLNADGTEQANARGLPFLSAKTRNRLRSESERGREYARTGFAKPTYCAWVMGAALAGRASDFRVLGGWDESYFLYYEDHEMGLRAWRRGIPVMLDPNVRWIHDWQRATSKPSLWAWRVELASMRTFYSDHPEFLLGGPSSRKRMKRVRDAGYDQMCQRLWRPVDVGGTS
jgi:N-acetylglucosaminyl-diphospho-decaprenol L-rhamnosyltransferase